MCGIFGMIVSKETGSKISTKTLSAVMSDFFTLSMSRGQDSSGISFKINGKIHTHKRDIPGKKFLNEPTFIEKRKQAYSGLLKNGIEFLGHCRMVTNGSSENPLNNQPVVKKNSVVVHNGIVCNIDQIWNENPSFKKLCEVDSEVLIDLLQTKGISETNLDFAVNEMYKTIEGSASIAYMAEDANYLLIASNNGSLYYSYSKEKGIFIFASEEFILSQTLLNLKEFAPDLEIVPLGNRTAYSINTETFTLKKITFEYVEKHNQPKDSYKPFNPTNALEGWSRHLIYNAKEVGQLKRCTKCVLPESFPFIHFDEQGVCNFCKNHIHVNQQDKRDEFMQVLNRHRNAKSKIDCIVPFSGGRDSSYGLHFLVKELGLKPITYTYDWGMVTDLARRNISRMCSALGVENILISADITSKRENIRKNVAAWLKKPELGMIPLFMAGDKQFLFYVNRIKKQTGVNVDVWMSNSLENTEFKSGFCGIRPIKDKTEIDQLKLSAKFQMLAYYGKNFLQNPGYLNSSLLDSLFAYFSYYFEPRENFTLLFNYIPWNEQKLNSVLLNEYGWEKSPDSPSTWRIGDGTASFYNYVYFTMAGFSEVDTFRSNQIREGMLSRDEALKLIEVENAPRPESIKWYLDTIGLDFESTIKTINSYAYKF